MQVVIQRGSEWLQDNDQPHDSVTEGETPAINSLQLMEFLTDFQCVERAIYVPKLKRRENDTEHSYNLAMMAWLIVKRDKLPLDVNLVIQYALFHDLVEIYAGDTFALDEEALKNQTRQRKSCFETAHKQPPNGRNSRCD